jgi:hypothetical protein
MTKEEKAAYNKKYREANRDRLRESLQAWKEKNRVHVRKYARAHRKENPEIYKASRKRQYEALTPERKAEEYQKTLARLRKTYGFTGSMFEDRLKEQRGKCAVCKVKKAVAADHNHKTKKARGILCKPCNHALGLFFESPEVLRNAALYLERWA